jgi:type IV secretory pathway TraG/TraD family ATPase VirD4
LPRYRKWDKQSEAERVHRRPILLPQEVTRLPSDKQLVLRAGIPPVLASKLRWFEDRNFRHLRRPPPVPDEIEIPISLDDGGALLPESNEGSARRMQPQMGRDHAERDDERELERTIPGGRG